MYQRFIFLATIYCATIVVLALQKILFLLIYLPSTLKYSLAEVVKVFWYGLLLDVSVAGYIMIIPLIMLIKSAWLALSQRLWQRAHLVYFCIIALVAATIFAGDSALYEYWGFRIDSSVLFYLKSPKGAAASVVWRDVAVFTLCFAVAFGSMFLLYRRLCSTLRTPRLTPLQSVVTTLGMLLCGGVIFLGIRGGVTASVANLSKVYFCKEAYLNHAAVNPIFSLVSTVGEEDDFVNKYQFYDDATLEQNLDKFNPPLSGEREALLNTTRPNILFIIGESFSESVYNLEVEGKWIMPHLRAMADLGISFPNTIANSFRTDRGVASTLYGFPAQPRTSIMKYPSKSRKLPSLARKLEEVGYSTEFVYGGDLNFTDMASMLYSTGWSELKWQQNIKIKGAQLSNWGYDDMIMSDFVVQRVMNLHDTQEPFILNWLTLSSHEPFDVPIARFDNKVLNSFAFADQAVGHIVESLRGTSVWDNLLIIVIADHAYTYPAGISYNSLQRHRIPMVWCGGALDRRGEWDRYISQMDVVATLLAEMHISTSEFEFSRDFMSDGYLPRGYYAFSDGFGVVTAQGAIVYDNSAREVISATADTTSLERLGKTILQRTMGVLSEY